MMLQLNFDEVRQLSSSMILMRREYKKVFKLRYRTQKDELMTQYDAILKQLGEWMIAVENSLYAVVDGNYELPLTQNEAKLLAGILKSYIGELQKVEQQAKRAIEGLETLQSIQARLNESYALFYPVA